MSQQPGTDFLSNVDQLGCFNNIKLQFLMIIMSILISKLQINNPDHNHDVKYFTFNNGTGLMSENSNTFTAHKLIKCFSAGLHTKATCPLPEIIITE